jgi:hypothetical protein
MTYIIGEMMMDFIILINGSKELRARLEDKNSGNSNQENILLALKIFVTKYEP